MTDPRISAGTLQMQRPSPPPLLVYWHHPLTIWCRTAVWMSWMTEEVQLQPQTVVAFGRDACMPGPSWRWRPRETVQLQVNSCNQSKHVTLQLIQEPSTFYSFMWCIVWINLDSHHNCPDKPDDKVDEEVFCVMWFTCMHCRPTLQLGS